MRDGNTMTEKYLSFRERLQPGLDATGSFLGGVGHAFKLVVTYLVRMRKVLLSIPVLVLAVQLAQYNTEHLPEQVGIDLQTTGEFALVISRNAAVMGPLVLTALCLVLMFCSRRTMYPWIISVFSLVLPLLLLLTNMYPA